MAAQRLYGSMTHQWRGLSWILLLAVWTAAGCGDTDDGSDLEMQVSNLGSSSDEGTDTRANLRFVDGDGAAIDVDQSDLEVTVEEKTSDGEWSEIEQPPETADKPPGLDVVVVADNSGSQEGHLGQMQSAIRSFADQLYGSTDRVRMGLVRVSSEAEPIQNLTPNATQFDAAVDRLHIRNGWTALWDGMRQGNRMAREGIVAQPDGNLRTCVNSSIRAVVTFTDGEENNSAGQKSERGDNDGVDTTLEDVRNMTVLGVQTPIFSVGIGDWDTEVLADLSQSTGGTMLTVDEYDELAGALERVGSQLNGGIPVCFDLQDPDSTQIRVTVTLTYEGETYQFQESNSLPDDRCEERSDGASSNWSPDTRVPSCDGSLESVGDLATLADLGCRRNNGRAVHETALDEQASTDYHPPTDAERDQLEQLLPDFFAALRDPTADLEQFADAFEQFGFHYRTATIDGTDWVVLTETGDDWRGAGGYLLRQGEASDELILQAPHSFHETHTGTLTRRMAPSGDIRGVFFNTLKRDYILPGMVCDPGVYPTDVAHVTNSFFHQLTTAYLTEFQDGTLVQLHGHSNETLLSDDVGAVVSSGTLEPTDQVRMLDSALGPRLAGQKVALYPEETSLYGGTLNIQGRWVRRELRGNFVHLELSLDQRRALLEHPSLRNEFAGKLRTITR